MLPIGISLGWARRQEHQLFLFLVDRVRSACVLHHVRQSRATASTTCKAEKGRQEEEHELRLDKWITGPYTRRCLVGRSSWRVPEALHNISVTASQIHSEQVRGMSASQSTPFPALSRPLSGPWVYLIVPTDVCQAASRGA